MPNNVGHPTILVVYEDRGCWDVLIRTLRQQEYLVLEAHNALEAFEIVKIHSRRIHVLLVADNEDSRAMAAALKPFRRDLKIIHVNTDRELSSILMEVSKVLELP